MSPCFARGRPAPPVSPEILQAQCQYFANATTLTTLVNAITEMVLVLNAQYQIVYANRAVFEFLGRSPTDALYGLSPGELFGCIHAVAPSAEGCGTVPICQMCETAQAIAQGLSGQATVLDCRIVQAAMHDALDLRLSTTPVTLRNETFVVFAVTDISHEKRRRVMERIFFHDILNAVGVLEGGLELLKGATPAENEELQGLLHQVSHDILAIVEAQRQLMAAESGELRVHCEAVQARSLLASVAHQYQSHPVAIDKHLVIAPTAEDVQFHSDPVLVRRVLENLVKNALEATTSGGTVTLTCAIAPPWVEFQVRHPTLMPPALQLQIFQRSFSTNGPGRGIGTYSVKLLTEQYLQGTVAFASAPATGTTFAVRYPLQLP